MVLDETASGAACSHLPSPPPIVLVPGFLAGTPSLYWDLDRLRERFPGQRFIAVSPGPLSSHHDRACEIYAQLKGGVVDYGEDHAREHGHGRYGRTYQALYPEWDASHPIHLVGHSIGGVTCRVLQQWLAEGRLCSDGAAEWVLSVSALCSPLNGDPVVHRLGASVDDPGKVAFGSCGWLLTTFTHLLSFLDVPLPLPDLQLEHWRLSRRHGLSAVRRLLLALLWRRSIGQGEDNAASELSFHSMLRLNRQLHTFPCTVYFSFAAKRQRFVAEAGAPLTRSGASSLCSSHEAGGARVAPSSVLARLCSSACVGAFSAVVRGDGRLRGWRGSGFREEEWLASDGLLSVHTQRHPLNQPWRALPDVTASTVRCSPCLASPTCADHSDCEAHGAAQPLTTNDHRSARGVIDAAASVAAIFWLSCTAILTAARRFAGCELAPCPTVQQTPPQAVAVPAQARAEQVALPPGVWHEQLLPGTDHFEIAGMASVRRSPMFEHFWESHVANLQAIARTY